MFCSQRSILESRQGPCPAACCGCTGFMLAGNAGSWAAANVAQEGGFSSHTVVFPPDLAFLASLTTAWHFRVQGEPFLLFLSLNLGPISYPVCKWGWGLFLQDVLCISRCSTGEASDLLVCAWLTKIMLRTNKNLLCFFSPRRQEKPFLGEQAMCFHTAPLHTCMFSLLEPSAFLLMLYR